MTDPAVTLKANKVTVLVAQDVGIIFDAEDLDEASKVGCDADRGIVGFDHYYGSYSSPK